MSSSLSLDNFAALPAQAVSRPALLITGLSHLALLWLVLQSAPVAQVTHQVVQYLKPITPPKVVEAPPAPITMAVPKPLPVVALEPKPVPTPVPVPVAAPVHVYEAPPVLPPAELPVLPTPAPVPVAEAPPELKVDPVPEPLPKPSVVPALPPVPTPPVPTPTPAPVPSPAPLVTAPPVQAPIPVPMPTAVRPTAITPVEAPPAGAAGSSFSGGVPAPISVARPPAGAYPYTMGAQPRQRSLAEMANEQLNGGRPRRDPLAEGVSDAAVPDCLTPNGQGTGLFGLVTIPVAAATGKCKLPK